MLKASSLFYATAIALVIALISSSLILFAYFNKLRLTDYNVSERTLINSTSGLSLLLSKQNIIQLNQQKFIDLYNEGNDTVLLKRKSWGSFEVIVSKAFSARSSSNQIALIGSGMPSEKKAIYLADQDKPLSLCGKTVIKGDCYLPKSGVKRAYIEGQSFSGNQLVEGTIKESSKNLPPLNNELIEKIKSIILKQMGENDSIIDMDKQQKLNDSIINSFGNNTIYLLSKENIIFSNQVYQGNIIIISDKEIDISNNCNLQDVLVMAPVIEVEDDFEGSLQLFATDSISISKNCKLNYPSALSLIRTTKSHNNMDIFIGEGTEIFGDVFAYEENLSPQKQIKINIEKNVKITGQVYSSGIVDLKGFVYGSVTCSTFLLSTPSSVYENHLLDATIDVTKLPEKYVGINLTETEQAKKIIKWIY